MINEIKKFKGETTIGELDQYVKSHSVEALKEMRKACIIISTIGFGSPTIKYLELSIADHLKHEVQ